MQITSIGAAAYAAPSAASAVASSNAASATDPVSEFMAMASKSPAQQMRDRILRELGVSEDDLKKMSSDQRAKVEQKVKELTREKVKESAEKKTGMVVDIKA